MEATALSVGKSVLIGAICYAKSALAQEAALQLGVQRDHDFIRDELEMMLAFLMAAHDEEHNKVVRTWVKQVRDVAYSVEDSLQEFTLLRLGKGKPPSSAWWRFLRDRRRVAARMKELRAKVEDVSQRNLRYQLVKGPTSPKTAITTEQSGMVMSGTEEAMRQRNKEKLDLIRLINNMKDPDLRVVAIWGTSSNVFGETSSIVRRAYDDLKRDYKFECQAWITIAHTFDPVESLQNIVEQLFVDSLDLKSSDPEAYDDLRRMGTIMKKSDLIGAFRKYMNDNSFLIVLANLSSYEDWGQIKECFPNNSKGSRLVVCTDKVVVASLCAGQRMEIPEHKQLSTDPTLLAFYQKDSQDGIYTIDPGPSSNMDITEDKNGCVDEKRFPRMGTIVSGFKESHIIGRVNEKSEIIKLISDNTSQEFEVLSICGMGGLGKTTLVKCVYQSQELCDMFEKRACVTVKRPFDPNELLDSLATQLADKDEEARGNREKQGNQMSLTDTLEGKKYVLVLDDLSSIAEWDAINHYFPRTEAESRIIVTTRVENIARHCSKKEKNIHKLQILGEKDACNLFTEKLMNILSFQFR